MAFVGGTLNVSLVTVHCPIIEVAAVDEAPDSTRTSYDVRRI